jgi:NAD(P)H-hydrate epimerase
MATLLAPAPALSIYAADQLGLITAPIGELGRYLEDPRISAVLIGPGAGRGASTRRHVLQVLKTGKPAVLDADALTVFGSDPSALFEAIHGPTLLTPHDGEFARLFKLQGSKLARAEGAAKVAGAAVLLKGYDTVVAAPDGRVAINANGPATLATAGAGDVLAGIALALLGQGLGAFEAAAAAAWLHGASAARFGAGLIAEDLPEGLPAVLGELRPG